VVSISANEEAMLSLKTAVVNGSIEIGVYLPPSILSMPCSGNWLID
jgi:hypothetical protein